MSFEKEFQTQQKAKVAGFGFVPKHPHDTPEAPKMPGVNSPEREVQEFSGEAPASALAGGDHLEEWERVLGVREAEASGLKERCLGKELDEDDIAALAKALELSGEVGLTLDVYAGGLKLKETDFIALLKDYPELERALEVSRVNRKKLQLRNLGTLSARNAGVAKQLAENPEFMKDSLQVAAETERTLSVEERVEKMLIEKGYAPCEYTQVVYLTGGAPSEELLGKEGLGKLGWIKKKLKENLGFITAEEVEEEVWEE